MSRSNSHRHKLAQLSQWNGITSILGLHLPLPTTENMLAQGWGYAPARLDHKGISISQRNVQDTVHPVYMEGLGTV